MKLAPPHPDPLPDTPSLVDRLAGGSQALTFNRAATLPELCVNGRAMNVGKLYRAARVGINGVKLDATPIAGTLVTDRPAVRAWLAALAERRADRSTPSGTTPRRQRSAARRAHVAAMAELQRAGLAGGRAGK